MQELCFYTFLINQIQSYTVRFGNRNYMEMCKHEPCGRRLHGPFSESLKIYYSTQGGLGPASQKRTHLFNTPQSRRLGKGASARTLPSLTFIHEILQEERPEPGQPAGTREPCRYLPSSVAPKSLHGFSSPRQNHLLEYKEATWRQALNNPIALLSLRISYLRGNTKCHVCRCWAGCQWH